MKITEAATEAILGVMKAKGLNSKTTFLQIGIFEGNLGLGFIREKTGQVYQFGDLAAVVSNNCIKEDVVIDYGEVNGKKGLIFMEGK